MSWKDNKKKIDAEPKFAQYVNVTRLCLRENEKFYLKVAENN
jgi:hypothetical protein